MIPLLGALAAAGLWYASTWAIHRYPLLMADVMIYGLLPAAMAYLGWSAVRLWQQTRR